MPFISNVSVHWSRRRMFTLSSGIRVWLRISGSKRPRLYTRAHRVSCPSHWRTRNGNSDYNVFLLFGTQIRNWALSWIYNVTVFRLWDHGRRFIYQVIKISSHDQNLRALCGMVCSDNSGLGLYWKFIQADTTSLAVKRLWEALSSAISVISWYLI